MYFLSQLWESLFQENVRAATLGKSNKHIMAYREPSSYKHSRM